MKKGRFLKISLPFPISFSFNKNKSKMIYLFINDEIRRKKNYFVLSVCFVFNLTILYFLLKQLV